MVLNANNANAIRKNRAGLNPFCQQARAVSKNIGGTRIDWRLKATVIKAVFTIGIMAARTMAKIMAADNNLSKNGAFFLVIKNALANKLPQKYVREMKN